MLCAALSVVWVAGLLLVPAFSNGVEGLIHQFLAANAS